RVVDAGEAGAGEGVGDAVDVGGEDEADPDDQVEAARGEEAHGGLAILGAAGLQDLGRDPELARRARNTLPGRVVEALVAAAADAEAQPDAVAGQRALAPGLGRPRGEQARDRGQRADGPDHAAQARRAHDAASRAGSLVRVTPRPSPLESGSTKIFFSAGSAA